MKELDLSAFNPIKTNRCSVTRAIGKLDNEKAELVRAALASEEIPNTMIARRLNEWGTVKVTPYTVGWHRRGDCACE